MRVTLKPLDQQVIVITGASSGIGLATARRAARQGAAVVLNSRDEQDILKAAEEIRADGGRAVHFTGDVADRAAMHELGEAAVREFGRIDTWVNNAGVSIYGRIEQVPVEDAERLFRTNYWGVVHGSLVALSHLKREGGVLINVGSVLSETGYPLQGHYAASKHAVKGFTDSLRLELEEEEAPVVVTLIQPTAIDTPYPEHAQNYLPGEPRHLPPVYDPEIVADAILSAAVRPTRNLRVGGGAKLLTAIEKVAPSVGDRLKVATGFEGQVQRDLPRRDDDTLHAPRPGDGRVHGRYPGRVTQRSLYTAMAQRPLATTLGLAAISMGVGIAARAMLEQRSRPGPRGQGRWPTR